MSENVSKLISQIDNLKGEVQILERQRDAAYTRELQLQKRVNNAEVESSRYNALYIYLDGSTRVASLTIGHYPDGDGYGPRRRVRFEKLSATLDVTTEEFSYLKRVGNLHIYEQF